MCELCRSPGPGNIHARQMMKAMSMVTVGNHSRGAAIKSMHTCMAPFILTSSTSVSHIQIQTKGCIITKNALFDSFLAKIFASMFNLSFKPKCVNHDRHSSCKIQTHKRFRRTLFIRTKHNLQIFRVIPFIKLQNNT